MMSDAEIGVIWAKAPTGKDRRADHIAFARAIEKATIERCAEICDGIYEFCRYDEDGSALGAKVCRDDIRALSPLDTIQQGEG
jgi:hypothetical protein